MVSQYLSAVGVPFLGDRERMYQRMVGNADDSSLKVLASVAEPPKGFPREGDREYDVYTPLNHLSDVIPAESDTARRFCEIAKKIAHEVATRKEWDEERAELVLLRDNDARLQPLLRENAVMLELQDVSRNLSAGASIGLAALDALDQHRKLDATTRQKYHTALSIYGSSKAELTLMTIPGIVVIVNAIP